MGYNMAAIIINTVTVANMEEKRDRVDPGIIVDVYAQGNQYYY
jgi:hypothetical protein